MTAWPSRGHGPRRLLQRLRSHWPQPTPTMIACKGPGAVKITSRTTDHSKFSSRQLERSCRAHPCYRHRDISLRSRAHRRPLHQANLKFLVLRASSTRRWTASLLWFAAPAQSLMWRGPNGHHTGFVVLVTIADAHTARTSDSHTLEHHRSLRTSSPRSSPPVDRHVSHRARPRLVRKKLQCSVVSRPRHSSDSSKSKGP